MDSNISNPVMEQILESARKLFARYGLDKTTMNEIAADVGLSKAALYYYFKDKESLFREVVAQEQKDFFGKMRGLTDRNLSAEELMQKYVELRLEHFKSFLNLAKLSMHILSHPKTLVSDLHTGFKQEESKLITQILERGNQRGEFHVNDPAKVGGLFIHVLFGLRALALREGGIEGMNDSRYELLKTQMKDFTNYFINGIK